MRRGTGWALSCAFILLVGCKETPVAPRRVPASVRAISGGGASDTVGASLPSPLVLQVLDTLGRPAAGVSVTLLATRIRGGIEGRVDYGVWLVRGTSRDSTATLTADTAGKVSVAVALGTVAGTAPVIVRVAALGLEDSVSFVALPGAPVGLRAFPHDTAVVLGGDFTLRYGVVDARGNVRVSDPVNASLSSAAIQLGASGLVHGSAYGRTTIAFSAGSMRDTARVSVVPAGVLGAIQYIDNYNFYVVTFNTDGSALKVLARINMGWNWGKGLAWSPDGSKLVFAQAGSFDLWHLYTVDLNGKVSRLMPDTSSFFRDYDGVYSRDGEWVYFSGELGGSSWNYRVRPNGSGAAQVLPGAYYGELTPTPAPDGRRLATIAAYGYDYKLVIKDLVAGTFATLDIGEARSGVQRLAWSPRGDLIAFLSWTDLYVIRPDGTGLRKLAGGWDRYATIGWSPDGRWCIGRTDDGVTLVNVETDALLPLGVRREDFMFDWRP